MDVRPTRRFALSAALLASACSATHIVRPLPRGTTALTASFGGPYVPSSVPTVVVPYLTLGVQRGVTDDLTLGGALHATMAAFGVAGLELNAARRVAAAGGWRPELVARGTLYAFAGRGGGRAYPAIGAVASWAAGPRTLWYVGADALAQAGRPHVVATPLAGVQRQLGRRAALQLDVKWMAANADVRAGVFEGESSIGGRGTLAAQVGFVWRRGAK